MQVTKMTNVKVATSSSYLYSVCPNLKKKNPLDCASF